MKNKDFSRRLIEFYNAVSPTQVDFASRLGISPQALQKYFKGGRLPMPEILDKLNKLGCNINWLLSGSGDMINEVKVFKPRTRPVAVIGEVECGVPITNQITNEAVKHIEMFDVSGLNNPFVVIARGDSMVPYINPGDLLLCADEPEKIKDGKAVVVNYKTTPESYMSNAKLIKFMDDESLVLYSVNTKYPPMTYRKTEIFKMYKVIRIIREVK